MNGLELHGLRKAYGDTVAVDDVELTVPAGSFYGLVGPNGAGKTTLLSMAVGLLAPDAGDAAVLGHSVWQRASTDQAKEVLGVLPSGLALPGRLTGRELLTYLGLLRGLPAAVVAGRCDEDGGNPTPAWSLKVHVALVAVALTAAPAAAVLALGGAGHDSAVSWLGVAVAA